MMSTATSTVATRSAIAPEAVRVALAAGAAFAASGAWYTAFGDRLAQYDPAYADSDPSPGWTLPVELARNAAVATTVAILSHRLRLHRITHRAALGAGLWAAFPAVLLTGSVLHEKVPWPQGAIHAGDWLVKLLLISILAGERRGHRARPSAEHR